MNRFNIFFDGGTHGRPGVGDQSGYGSWEVEFNGFSKKISRMIFKASDYKLSAISNNSAEYLALAAACVWLQSVKDKHLYTVVIHGDSQLVINQILGDYKAKAPHLRHFCRRIRELLKDFNWTAQWQKRDHNVSRFGH